MNDIMKLFDNCNPGYNNNYGSIHISLIDTNGNFCNAYLTSDDGSEFYRLDLHIYSRTYEIRFKNPPIFVVNFNIIIKNMHLSGIKVFYTKTIGDILIDQDNCIIDGVIEHVHHSS